MKKTYTYSYVTGEFLLADEAALDPLESEIQGKNVYLLPADSTFTEPPEAKAGFARVWNGDAWEYVEDHRKAIVWKSYAESMQIKDLGPLPSGYSETRPEPPQTKEVRTFSKFGIWVATRNLPIAPGSEFTVWETFETFLSEQKLMSGWAQLVDLVEDNPFFEEFYPKAVETFGKELVDNVLAASVVGTKTVIVEG